MYPHRLDTILLAVLVFLPINFSYAQGLSSSPLGSYGQTSTYCGHNPIQKDVTKIPEFGCFILSPGHSAQGTFSGHQIKVSVDETGTEVFTADGTVVTEMRDPKKQPQTFTNLPYVQTQGEAGFAFCPAATDGFCPSHITIFSRNPDKTILFTVMECLPPTYQRCVITKENWDYETSKRK